MLPDGKHKKDNKQKMKPVKRCSYESVRKEICMDMDRRLKWISYAALTIVFLVTLAMIAFGTYIYVSYNDKSGIVIASAGVVSICFEIVALILYFRRAKTAERK